MPAIQASDPGALAHYMHIVDQIPDAVVFADLDGVIRVWNAGAEAVFGFSAAEAVGSSLDIIIPERFRRAHWEGYYSAIGNGHTRHSAQVRTTRAIHKDGRKQYVELSFGVVVDAVGAVLGAVAVGRDGTARHLSDSALRARLTELEEQTRTGVSCAVTDSRTAPPARNG